MIVLNSHIGQQPFAADWREGLLWRRPPADRMPFLLCEQNDGFVGGEPRLLDWSRDHYRAALVPWRDWMILEMWNHEKKIGAHNHTSSTAQGGWRKFQSRKPIGEAPCCEWMAERTHWWTDTWLAAAQCTCTCGCNYSWHVIVVVVVVVLQCSVV